MPRPDGVGQRGLSHLARLDFLQCGRDKVEIHPAFEVAVRKAALALEKEARRREDEEPQREKDSPEAKDGDENNKGGKANPENGTVKAPPLPKIEI